MSAAEKVPRDVIELVKTKSVFIGACAFTTSVYGKDDSINLTDPISIQTYGLLAATPEPQSRALLFTSPYSLEVPSLTYTCMRHSTSIHFASDFDNSVFFSLSSLSIHY